MGSASQILIFYTGDVTHYVQTLARNSRELGSRWWSSKILTSPPPVDTIIYKLME